MADHSGRGALCPAVTLEGQGIVERGVFLTADVRGYVHLYHQQWHTGPVPARRTAATQPGFASDNHFSVLAKTADRLN